MTTQDLIEQVRTDCAAVAADSRQVRIDTEAIAAYLRELPQQPVRPVFDDDHHYRSDDPELTALAVFCLDAVNFGSGWFPRLRKRPNSSGYATIAVSIKEWFLRQPPKPAELAQISPGMLAEIFGQHGNRGVADLMVLFATALNELGAVLLSQYAGQAIRLVEAADHRATRLAELLAELATFADTAEWHGRPVAFWKRAQLTAVDLALAFDSAGPGRFDDLHRLTIFADNLVPHVLRTDGLLRYDADLSDLIGRGDLLAPGSPAEVEIRACAVHAVELMVAESDQRFSAAEFDYWLWNRGQAPPYRVAPRHRTETTSY